jgi:hypothetical protein
MAVTTSKKLDWDQLLLRSEELAQVYRNKLPAVSHPMDHHTSSTFLQEAGCQTDHSIQYICSDISYRIPQSLAWKGTFIKSSSFPSG